MSVRVSLRVVQQAIGHRVLSCRRRQLLCAGMTMTSRAHAHVIDVRVQCGATASGNVCARCAQPIANETVVRAVNRRWHERCLQCHQCGVTLGDGELYEKRGEPHCANCAK
jgi:hypothetical protein